MGSTRSPENAGDPACRRRFERHSKIALFGEVGNFDTAKPNREDRVVGQPLPRFIRGIQIISVSFARADGV